jgi:hypothetical protein
MDVDMNMDTVMDIDMNMNMDIENILGIRVQRF